MILLAVTAGALTWLGVVGSPPPLTASCTETGTLLLTVDDLTFAVANDEVRLADGPRPSARTQEAGATASREAVGATSATDPDLPTGTLLFPVRTSIVVGSGWLVAAGGNAPGLFRVAPPGLEPTLLREGEVLALCGSKELVLAALATGGRPEVVSLSTAAPAPTLMSLGKLARKALRSLDERHAASATRLLDLAVRRALPELAALLSTALEHPSPATRARAAPFLAAGNGDSAQSSAGLWLLAHDVALSVRESALTAVRERCGADTSARCNGLLAMFIEDADEDVAWTARDELLGRVPETALLGASIGYKLDAVAVLAARREREGAAAVDRALGLLADDDNATVRLAARTVRGAFD